MCDRYLDPEMPDTCSVVCRLHATTTVVSKALTPVCVSKHGFLGLTNFFVRVGRVMALYDYVARSERELTFRAGDLLVCTDVLSDDW